MLIGLLAPFIGVAAFYYIKFFPTFSFREYFRVIIENKPVLTAVSSIALMVNVIIFTIYINRRLDNTAKGIFLLTCVYIISVLLYKLI